MEQFLRTQLLIGKESLNKLQKSRVLVAGLGAVGGWALEALVRSGVGSFTLADFDTVEITNLNRQILATHSTLNIKKTQLAKARVLDINPNCHITAYDIYIDENTIGSLFGVKPDFVVDAIDSFAPKVKLMSYCYSNGIPIISSMGAALKTDPFSIKIDDISKTRNCRLASDLRRSLKKQGILSGIPCVFSTQSPQVKAIVPPRPARKTLASMATVTAMFGLHAAHYAIKKISEN
ncbi:MAG: tRNA threonylcarbamoyladenosine dehydratase [Elusimicrobia bacterium]|nr:tRNA threonylcarbamoyladenosine dehydratase [Elusimicrobiota bacterium]